MFPLFIEMFTEIGYRNGEKIQTDFKIEFIICDNALPEPAQIVLERPDWMISNRDDLFRILYEHYQMHVFHDTLNNNGLIGVIYTRESAVKEPGVFGMINCWYLLEQRVFSNNSILYLGVFDTKTGYLHKLFHKPANELILESERFKCPSNFQVIQAYQYGGLDGFMIRYNSNYIFAYLDNERNLIIIFK